VTIIADKPSYVRGPVTEFDNDHFVEWPQYKGDAEPGASGGILWHRKSDGDDGWCCGSFWFRDPPFQHAHQVDKWTLNSREPLDLSPSFLCWCGHHGFIHGGKWVSA
jgi:hypothetical protein